MGTVTFAHFLAGVVGLALVRHADADGDVNDTRLAELADVLARRGDMPFALALNPAERSIRDGYAEWAESYDRPNPMIALEEPIVTPILERVSSPGTRALDAACGTGRHARLLDALGCVTVGIDQSAEMLDGARSKVPGATFHQGDIERMPFDDDAFDLAVISLALCHFADPTNALVELGRVLAPGGTLVITDPHPMTSVFGGHAFYGRVSAGRTLTYVRNHRHSASTWLRAFAAAGLVVADCIEVPMTDEQMAGDPGAMFFPDAVAAAYQGLANIWVWELRSPT